MRIMYKVAILLIIMIVYVESHSVHHHHHHHKLHKARKIHRGKLVKRGEAKFMALIVASSRVLGTAYCSAVIITDRMILTAAHCLNYSQGYDRVEVLPGGLGANQYDKNRHLLRRIQNFWIHPKYKLGIKCYYDIGIAKVDQPWRLGGQVETAQMPVQVRSFDQVRYKGYGYGKEAAFVWIGNLNKIEFKQYLGEMIHWERRDKYKLDRDVCFEVTNYEPNTIPSGPSSGDSGSGIFKQGVVERLDLSNNEWIEKRAEILVGIYSAGNMLDDNYENPKLPYSDTYVNVTTLLPWITAIAEARFDTYPYPVKLSRPARWLRRIFRRD